MNFMYLLWYAASCWQVVVVPKLISEKCDVFSFNVLRSDVCCVVQDCKNWKLFKHLTQPCIFKNLLTLLTNNFCSFLNIYSMRIVCRHLLSSLVHRIQMSATHYLSTISMLNLSNYDFQIFKSISDERNFTKFIHG